MASIKSIPGITKEQARVTDSSRIDIQDGFSESEWLVTRDGTRNYKGEAADKSKTGGLKTLPLLFASEFAEKCSSLGATINLITYLVFEKHMHLSDAANTTTNYVGSSQLLTLVGGFLADSYIGRFWTIVVFTVIAMLGLGVLVINASVDKFKCSGITCEPPHGLDKVVLYLGLYLLALGGGGMGSSVSGFGADQFEKEDPNEAKYLPSYFNWFYFVLMVGVLLGQTLIIYIEDRSWPWGFATLLIIMFVSLVLLVSIMKKYRYRVPEGSPLTSLARVIVAAVRNWNLPLPADNTDSHGYYYRDDSLDVPNRQDHKLEEKFGPSNNIRWLNKAAVVPQGMTVAQRGRWSLTTVKDVENFKLVLRLMPVLATTWFFWTAQAQFLTFTVTQATTTNRKWGSFEVPAASVGAMKTIFLLLALLVYDRVFLPVARRITGRISGITTLQRMGVGLAISILSMICAALVERRRLQEVRRLNFELNPFIAMKSFTMFWYAPQYFVTAVAEAFLYPAQTDFFYNESPDNMQSLGTSLFLASLAIGSFGSSVVVNAVNSASSPNWLQDNINVGRLDLFYWTMAVLSAINFVAFLVAAYFHKYKDSTILKSAEHQGADRYPR